MRGIEGTQGFADKLVKYRRDIDDVRLWDPELMGVLRAKNDIRTRVLKG
jgi:hypothetical protein